MVEAIISAFSVVTTPFYMLMLLCGVGIGIVVGILPGIGGTVAMAIALPFIFRIENPYAALALIIGAGSVCVTSDSITAILFGTPGTVAGAPTIMEGYPMAKKGEAARALGASFTASLIGGLFGALCLTISLPLTRPLILLLGSPEFFMLSLLGITTMAMLGGQSPLKGCSAAGLGMLIGAIGGAPGIGVFRYTFDQPYLFNGVPLVPLALGLFAMPEMIEMLTLGNMIAESGITVGKGLLDGIKDAFRHIGIVLKGSAIGAYIGIVPGVGGSSAAWLAYAYAAGSARGKERDEFGKGSIRGLLAPEAANNACVGGDMIPTILFGIPGGAMMALLLAAFIVIGINPGREMVTTRLDLTISMIWSLAFANVLGCLICMTLARPLARITTLPIHCIVPFFLLVVILGAFQTTRHWGDLIVILFFGTLGWFMKRFRWPRPPLLVGFVLGNIAEKYLYISLMRYGTEVLLRPGVIIIGLVIIFSIFAVIFWNKPVAGVEDVEV